MQELIRQFGVDWKLLIAQIINFIVLLFVLKRFAYTPIINMLRERKQRIEAGMHASEEAKRQLAHAEEERKTVILKAEQEAVKIVNHAETLARDEAKAIVLAAQGKTDELIAAGKKKLEEERLKRDDEFTAHAEQLIKRGLAATIRKMHPTERDEALISEALKELRTIQ